MMSAARSPSSVEPLFSPADPQRPAMVNPLRLTDRDLDLFFGGNPA
jgi:hypothetical protein